MKKYIFPVCFSVAALALLAALVFLFSDGFGLNPSFELVTKQNEEVKQFFFENKAQIEKIKSGLAECDYDIERIEKDGNIILKDEQKLWLQDISPDICDLMNDAEKVNIDSIYYDKTDGEFGTFRLDAYFSENAMNVAIIYFADRQEDLKDEYGYAFLGDNWYLFSMGMT